MSDTVITISPSRLRNFGESRESTFCLVTSPGMASSYDLQPDAKYPRTAVVEYDGGLDFGAFLAESVPENAHVLVILPDTYFRSPSAADLGPKRKLAVMACSSTPTSFEAIAHFLAVSERTDPAQQETMVDTFFAAGESTSSLRFVDEEYGTEAEFQHLTDNLAWHEQAGFLDWGEQQLFPAGEVSVLPVAVFGQDIDSGFMLDGTLALRGLPVLHAGTPSYLRDDQARLFEALATLSDAPVIAAVKGGTITELEPSSNDCAPAARVLEALIEVDSRYSTVLELGFGINTALTLFPGNSAMNEVYGGSAGAVHVGLGLTPFTQYHLDIVCPYLRVESHEGHAVFGGVVAAKERGR